MVRLRRRNRFEVQKYEFEAFLLYGQRWDILLPKFNLPKVANSAWEGYSVKRLNIFENNLPFQYSYFEW